MGIIYIIPIPRNIELNNIGKINTLNRSCFKKLNKQIPNFIKSFPIKKINKLYLIGDGLNSNKIKKNSQINLGCSKV